eukprot:Em0011g807a
MHYEVIAAAAPHLISSWSIISEPLELAPMMRLVFLKLTYTYACKVELIRGRSNASQVHHRKRSRGGQEEEAGDVGEGQKPDQPLERPEESDNRTLYERLKEQKDKHQEEWEEQFKFKNMIYKGLDDEEAQFLHFVMQREAEQASQRWEEEVKEVTAYREAVAKLKEEQLATEVRTSATAPEVTQSAIKRKGSRSSTSEDPKEEAATEKKQKLEARARESEEDNNRANKHQSVEVSRNPPRHYLVLQHTPPMTPVSLKMRAGTLVIDPFVEQVTV